MAIVYIGLLFAAFIAALIGFYAAVIKLEGWRHRRGFARVAAVLGGEVEAMGTHARWTLWGLRAAVDGCAVDIQAAVSGTTLHRPAGAVGPQRTRLLATRVRARRADGAVVERWADLPTSRRRVAAVVEAARDAARS